ncbi:MAG: hypothetical protein CM15mV9_0680 [uncultured marine virus]|nr:MAG: hypothetical protein CM15mV9_0680 [uncultured marine virus]
MTTTLNEIKSQLAKLLATEDLIVEHKPVETASFNVSSRVLTLPVWDASENVYDMLVSHEVSHALYTPDTEWYKDRQINPSFVNIVEDARVEKLMKRRYAGISKTFFNGYQELSDKDFFGIELKDIDEMNLADKINLYFKIGNFVDIDFTVEEEIYRSQVEKAETFEDTLDAAEALFKYCQAKLEEKKEQEKLDMESAEGDSIDDVDNNGSDTTDEQGSSEEEGELAQGVKPTEDEEGSTEEQSAPSGGSTGGLEVETADSLEEAIKNLAQTNVRETVYWEIPQVDLKRIIISNETIHELCDTQFAEDEVRFEEMVKAQKLKYPDFDYYKESSWNYDKTVDPDATFVKFKRSAQKEVNYLVKEFECKKSASAYARATTSRTGVLDTSRLHTYKYSEDLFKKVTVLPEGKNHGLVFILDWSGSMSNVMLDTVKQLYNLLWFCKKVQIPFEVYAFTHDYPNENRYIEERSEQFAYTVKDGLAMFDPKVSLMNIFTSKVKGKELEKQMKNIWRIVNNFGYCRTKYQIPLGMSLSGTPLNDTLIALHQLIPDFKSKNKVEKVQCVILTDGESNHLSYHVTVQRSWDDHPYQGYNSIPTNSYLRDRKTGRTYLHKGDYYHHTTQVLLRNLRDNFPDTNFIGIRILASRDANYFLRTYLEYQTDEIEKYHENLEKAKSICN